MFWERAGISARPEAAIVEQLLSLQHNPQRTSREVKTLTARHFAKLQRRHDACAGNDCSDCTILAGLEER